MYVLTDCPRDVGNMTKFAASFLPMNCHIMSECTAVECCIDFQDPLQQTIHFFLDLDMCMKTLRVGIEDIVSERTLFSYQYGMKDGRKVFFLRIRSLFF